MPRDGISKDALNNLAGYQGETYGLTVADHYWIAHLEKGSYDSPVPVARYSNRMMREGKVKSLWVNKY